MPSRRLERPAREVVRVERLERLIPVVFERAPALTERLLREAPHGSADALLRRARRLLDEMTEAEKVAVLNAHPRIGADPTTLSEASRREQGGPEGTEVRRGLAALNDAYERRFGFRFVAFVDRRPRSALVPILRERLGRSREAELATGLEEFLAIARDRLEHA